LNRVTRCSRATALLWTRVRPDTASMGELVMGCFGFGVRA
jgi:hypothetical protein